MVWMMRIIQQSNEHHKLTKLMWFFILFEAFESNLCLTARSLLECYLKHLIVIQFSKWPRDEIPISILEKFNVKLRKNAKRECYCVYN